MKTIKVLLMACVCFAVAMTTADAKPRKKKYHRTPAAHIAPVPVNPFLAYLAQQQQMAGSYAPRAARKGWGETGGSRAKPRKWCGWEMRRYFGWRHGPAYNRAAHWRNAGYRVHHASSGVLVVWPHHVGIIKGACDGYVCPVYSGNDGAPYPRTRMRNIRGAVLIQPA